MKKLLMGLLLVSASLFAQSPTSWVGAGMGYNASGSPKSTGWVSYAKLCNTSAWYCVNKNHPSYLYSSYDIVLVGTTVTSSARSGVGVNVTKLQLGNLEFNTIGFMQAGVATSGSNTITASFSGGGMEIVRFKHDFTLEGGVRLQKFGSNNVKVFETGFGKAF